MIDLFKDYPHSKDAYIYACHVIKGRVPANKTVIQSCQRFIDDLSRDFKYSFDPVKAEKVCRFIENLPHTKGKWAAKGKDIELEGWQKFILCNLFGWVGDHGNRRFRKSYLKIPRKNGKSILVAAIGNYMLTSDGEFGAEIYCGATTEKQAWEVFTPARLMAARTPDLTDKFGIEVNAKSLTITDNGSKFEPLIGNPGDGSSPSLAIADEYHEHDSDEFVSTMETGMGSRDQPLLLAITTAGDNTGGPCYDMETECEKLLDGVFEDERMFCIMYGIDDDEDWTDPAILEKANPNIDVSVSREFLEAQQAEAIRNATKQNAFKRKHLNQWVGAHTSWMNMETLKKCVNTDLKAEDFKGKDCVFTVDLASKIDIAATMKVFSEVIKGKVHYTAFMRSYLPEDRIIESSKANYMKWCKDGWLTSTEGNEIDLGEIERDLKADAMIYSPNDVSFDPKYATQMKQNIADEAIEVFDFAQNTTNFSDPMYELEGAIYSGRFHYDGNPVLTWMFSNVVCKADANDNIYPRKQKPQNKIDGVIALIMGIGRFMAADESINIDDFINNPVTA
ncbi:MAG: terminase large subunit [Ketobacter sp.]|nr:terminase large subunit [Ketobacter sp.]